MRWDYLGRPGYPGWHLECSSIIHAELGETIDIHTGGIDHIPVHHTNEIAQTEAAFEQQLAKYWLHCNFLTINGQKISKSLGNIITLADLYEKGYSPLDFKMWVLQGQYQSERDFSFESLEAAKTRRLNWRNRIAKCYQGYDSNPDFEEVLVTVRDNLNSPLAFAVIDAAGNGTLEFWQQVDRLFGLDLIASSPKLDAKQENLLKERAAARKNKDYDLSDQLRSQLIGQGINVLDTPNGQIWQYT